ncbi:MAG: hypothetical protein A2025_03410 [Chloroflexi bacterium RBG_19FT_COMBO_47_15]|nr:MAG: hypothetical protein A2025_03410 [Chloroflexi bacterium RBG_19FT_COMBO_47_15]
MEKKEAPVIDWAKLTREMECLLRLKTSPVAYKRLEKVEELEKIPGVMRLNRKASFCQAPALARMVGMTVGVTRDNLGERCARICGLAATTEKEVSWEANAFANTWFATAEEARKQMAAYPLVPPGEALVLAPLASGKFDPDVILIYGNPAQMMLLMNGLQFKDYERFQFFFIGEGSCADGLAQCYTSGKPALAIPCMGERAFGTVTEDELVLALPPGMMAKAVEGLQALRSRGIGYPIMYLGPLCDPSAVLTQIYPDWYQH